MCSSDPTPLPPRVNYHRATCTSIRVDGTPSGVRQDKSGVGNVCRCNTPFASCVKSKERRTGAFGRRLGYNYEERLGITSNVIITAARPFVGRKEDTVLIFTRTRTQVESFEAPLEVSGLRDANIPFNGIFIRAPVRFIFFSGASLCSGAFVRSKVITELLQALHEPPIEIISRIPDSLLPHHSPDGGPTQTVVALRQGRHLLTTFHPELTGDNRFHEYFVQKCVVSSLTP
jgi:SNO glutamine amidotransferase family